MRLFDIDDDEIGKRGTNRSNGDMYKRYRKALEPHIDWIVSQINASPKKKIVVGRDEFAESLGFKLRDEKTREGELSETNFLLAIKGVLFVRYGIKIDKGLIMRSIPVYILRMREDGDTLSKSRAKMMNVDIYGIPKEESVGSDYISEE